MTANIRATILFLLSENKHKITWKTLDIALDRLLQGSCFHLVEFCQMIIEHHPATSDLKNIVLDNLQIHNRIF